MLTTEVDGEMVMMDVEKGVYFGLDAIEHDVLALLSSLAAQGLVETC